MNVLKKQRTRWLITTMALVFAVTTLLMIWGTFTAWRDRNTQIFDAMLQTDAIVRKDLATLYELNDAGLGYTCNDAMLKVMRLAELNSQYLYEYGFVNNGKLMCTTTLGVLPKPAIEAPYDLVGKYSGISFRRAVPITSLPGNVVAMRVKYGHFQALIRPFVNPTGQLDWLHAEVFAFTDEGFTSLYDNPSMMPRGNLPSSRRQSWLERGRWVEQLCYGFETCGLSIINIMSLARDKLYLCVIAFLCTVAITSLSGALSWQLHKRHTTIARQLKRGLRTERIKIVYQPIIGVDDDSIRGCEVLCRWQDENGSMLEPDAFIPHVEANGQQQALTTIVIKQALHELSDAKLLGKLKVAFNSFPEDISSGNVEAILRDSVAQKLHNTIALEITEKEIENLGAFSEGLERLRAMKLKIAIDDFGTGYSNLKHLEDLNIDYVKIDKSFIRGLAPQLFRGSLVAHIINMAHSLRLRVIAEGVEKEYQYDQLKRLGADYSQGFFHAAPMTVDELADQVRNSTKRPKASVIALEAQ